MYARPRVIRGTRVKPLPLLPSGPGGVCSRPLHEARSLTTKRAKESKSTGRPARINTTPAIRSRDRPKNGGSIRHLEIHQGTKPATVQGASTKNNADPKMAEIRLIPDSF
jgi:hypothetical protein